MTYIALAFAGAAIGALFLVIAKQGKAGKLEKEKLETENKALAEKIERQGEALKNATKENERLTELLAKHAPDSVIADELDRGDSGVLPAREGEDSNGTITSLR